MNRKQQYYSKVKNLIEGLIVLPETDADEDKTLREILNLMTMMCDKHQEQQQPVNTQLQQNFNYAKEQGGAF